MHTLPTTIKRYNMRVVFTTKDGAGKAYYIKRYFNESIQKDIWDLVIMHDATIKSKFVNKGSKGESRSGRRILDAEAVEATERAQRKRQKKMTLPNTAPQ